MVHMPTEALVNLENCSACHVSMVLYHRRTSSVATTLQMHNIFLRLDDGTQNVRYGNCIQVISGFIKQFSSQYLNSTEVS